MSQRTEGIRRDDLPDLFHQIVENIPNMVFVKDADDLRFVLFNRAGEELLGRSRDELLGRNDYDFFPQEQADFFTRKDREVLDSGQVLDIPEEPIETPRGRRWLHTKKVNLLAPDWTPRFLLGISEDITERRAAERLKDDVLSVASHELRSPTAAMLGTLGLLERAVGPQLDERSKEMLDLARENGGRMLDLIDACLDMGRLEQEQLRLHVEAVDLGDAVRSAIRLNQPFADRYGTRFEAGAIASPALVHADPRRLGQVLTNVMTNAAKFSPPGEPVVLEVTAAPDGYRVSIRDRGPGIPEAFQPRVFQRFSRARTRESSPQEGSGLGLHIARELVERMGGSIGFESAPERGTTFHVDLPAA